MATDGRKLRTFQILEIAERGDTASRVFDVFIFALIAGNVLAVILETVGDLHERYADWFALFELVSVAIFSVEYVLRLWSATVVPGYSRPFLGRLRYATTPMLLVDLVAIAPFYLSFILPLDLRFVRVLRLLRLAKLTRHSSALHLLGNVLRAKRSELVLAYFVLFLALIFTSSAMYFIEHDAQPDAFSSIPESMWWGVVTLGTVGYGDIVPETPLGKAAGGVFILLGIAAYALPVAVLASGFTEELQKRKGAHARCPHCGKEIP